MKDNEPSVSPSFATCPRVIREVVQWHAIEHAFLRHSAFARHFDFPERGFASLSAFQVFWLAVFAILADDCAANHR
jgi:hypothetical protein